MTARRQASRWQCGVALMALAAAAWAVDDSSPPPTTTTAPTPPATTRSAPRPLTVTDDQVTRAIKAGVDFLLRRRIVDNWESGRDWPMRGQYGGETALVTYALLHAGESLRDDPVYGPKLHFRSDTMAPTIAWLTRLESEETYTVALQACALGMLPVDGDAREGRKAALDRAKRYLVSAMGPDGGYSYGQPRSRISNAGFDGYGDLSNAQYGALGMWALEEAGMPAPAGYWQKTDKFWRTLQGPSGRWPYRANLQAWREDDSMGMAGIATLFLVQEFTDRTIRGFPKQDKALDTGMAWLNSAFTSDFGDLYSIYSIERIGLASGIKTFGGKDWFQELAANVVAHQNESGAWDQTSWDTAHYSSFSGATATTATSYALLFLARGRNPVVLNKLQYDGYWNSRPHDAAFLTRQLSRRLERPLNWQTVDLATDPATWTDAPLLLLTGSKDPLFKAPEIARLRDYVERGGMILSTSDESTPAFTEAIKKIARELSGNKWEMRKLTPDHVLYQGGLNADLKEGPILLGMSNGLREVWVHSPMDLGATWQRQQLTSKAHFEIPAALYFYATGRMGQANKLKAAETPTAADVAITHPLKLARLIYTGNWDPEPGGWRRFAPTLRPAGIVLQIEPTACDLLDLKMTPIAHLTGTTKFDLRPPEAAALKNFLDAGGTLLADSPNPAFQESLATLLQQLYPGEKLSSLPPDHPLFTGQFPGLPGQDIHRVKMRKYADIAAGKPLDEPLLDALLLNGRPAVLLSRYDLTSGLTGNTAWGVLGYAPDSARAVAGNMLRLALTNNK